MKGYENISIRVTSKTNWENARSYSTDLSKMKFLDDKNNEYDIFDIFTYNSYSTIFIPFPFNCSQIKYEGVVVWRRKWFQKILTDMKIDLFFNTVFFNYKTREFDRYYFTDEGPRTSVGCKGRVLIVKNKT